jgi:hypothetical protein
LLPDLNILHEIGDESKPVSLVRRKNPRFARPPEDPGLEPGWAKSDKFSRLLALAGAASDPAAVMTKEEERELREQLARLQQEHRDLDAAISALQDARGSDMLQVQRLKKRKLYLRDRISFIEDELNPDIIA